jgi:hypothetical protein
MRKRKMGLAIVVVIPFLFLVPLAWSREEKAQFQYLLVISDTRHLLLAARVTHGFTEKGEAAVLAGVPTRFTFLIDLYRQRPCWFDQRVLRKAVSHTVKYDNVKKVFGFATDAHREPALFPDLESAKRGLADVNGIPVARRQSLSRGEPYDIRLRAQLDKPRAPFSREDLCFFFSSQEVETDWYRGDFSY